MEGYNPPAMCMVEGCGGVVWGEDGYCWTHDPANREQVLENVSRAGAGHGDPRLEDLRKEYQALYTLVKDTDYSPTRANTLVRILAGQVDIVRAERDVSVEQLKQTLEEIKDAVREQGIPV